MPTDLAEKQIDKVALDQQDQIASPQSILKSVELEQDCIFVLRDPNPDYVWNLGYGVTITIDKDRNVVISGYNSLKFTEDADVEINATNVKVAAKDTVSIEAKHHAILEADRVDLNPDWDDSDFLAHIRKLRRNGRTSL